MMGIFHFHKWTDWAITEKGRVLDYYKGNITVGNYLTQSRHCLSCGKTQTQTQSTPRIRSFNLHLVPDTKKERAQHDRVS